MTTTNTIHKADVLRNFLEGDAEVLVHLDPRVQGTILPDDYAGHPQLVLQLGYAMAVPIPDLVIDETGFCCTLYFNHTPRWVFVPWAAVFAMAGRIGSIVWSADVPAELRQPTPAAPAGGNVIDLMSRRTPKDRHMVTRRLAKLTARRTGGGDAA